MKNTFYSNGKLLLTAEYVVLDGALALAVPTVYGQSLEIKNSLNDNINWKSFDTKKNVWFQGEFDSNTFEILNQVQNDNISDRLYQILTAARSLNSNFLTKDIGFNIETYLDFPKNWGLGTSSTLINNIAQWAQVDPFELLELTFGGSGYDIACAQHDTPITYQLLTDETLKRVQGDNRSVKTVNFNPPFKENLYFVYLNKKQNSREGIAHYKALKHDLKPIISKIDTITHKIINCDGLREFQELLEAHETIISKLTKQETVKSLFFDDFKGSIKSLGAWGGDFALAASEENPTNYFNDKGFDTIIPYSKMVK